MSGFISNSNMYNITTENEVASVLSHFNSEFIFDLVRDNLQKKFNYNTIVSPNIVASFEQNFKQIMSIYQDDTDRINEVRTRTYKEIISIICQNYNLQFNDSDDIDYYSAAMHLYDFLVAGFSNYLEQFFANYIYKERNGIYEALNLSSMKKNKDSSTLYGKKTYKDIKLAVINANLEFVIQNICAYDINLATILSNVYTDRNVINYILTIISPIHDFFKTSYVSVFQSDIRAIILSNIRFKIQNLCIDLNA